MRIDLVKSLKRVRSSDNLRSGLKDLRAFGEQLVSMQLQGLVFGKTFDRDACVGYLADHMDAAIELAEKIAKLRLDGRAQRDVADGTYSGPWVMSGDAIVVRFGEIRTFVHDLKTLELAFTSKISQARVWAERVQRYDPRLDRVAGLLLAGTHAFIDAGAAQADTTAADFQSSDPTLFYLRSRGLIAADATSLDEIDVLDTGYGFKVWGGVSLYDVVEMMHAFLGAADVHYSLYEPDQDEADAKLDETDDVAPHVTSGDVEDATLELAENDTLELDMTPPVADVDVELVDADDDAVGGSSDGNLGDLAEPVPVMGTVKSSTRNEDASDSAAK